MINPVFFQRIEGGTVFIAATFVYFNSDFNWLFYVLLLFAFDIFMLGYMINSKIGAITYNIGHSFIVPSLLTVAYTFTEIDWVLAIACLWFAHIGIDRALGFGLKTSKGFKHTHLGDI